MCGILGVIVNKPSPNIRANLLKMYMNQKHRGHYGCGIAKMSYRNTMTRKRGVHADSLFDGDFEHFYHNLQKQDRLIVHHRFASHGGEGDVLESNHPFIDEDYTMALIHNGVIGNYDRLYSELRKTHSFESELRLMTKHNIVLQQQITDSEVILHLIDKNPIAQAEALNKLNGSVAIAVLHKGTRGILLYRWRNPLIVSKDELGNYYFSSEFKSELGLQFVESLTEGIMYQLTTNGLQQVSDIRQQVEVPAVTAKKSSYSGTYDGYKLNKDTGLWEESEKDEWWKQ